jgi:DHA1 family bicyclomycin/chloramphenicol resistance-like MFS transporter
VTSFGCALAHNITLMAALRLLQGIGAGTCLVLAAAMAADCFRGAQLVSVLAWLGAAWGAAPIIAPAIGGFVVQFGSWRLVFVLYGLLTAAVAVLVATALPETLEKDYRTPVHWRAAAQVLREGLRHRIFLGFVVMFGLIAAAQMVFSVASPFIYQVELGFSPAAYGLIALVVGTANLAGALACGMMAQRTTTRRLALGACTLFVLSGAILVVSAEYGGITAQEITIGAVLAMLAIGVLDPLSKGLAMGVFKRNMGLIAGVVTTCCYLMITLAMALIAHLPENSQAPLGWFYIGAGALFIAILLATLARPERAVSV